MDVSALTRKGKGKEGKGGQGSQGGQGGYRPMGKGKGKGPQDLCWTCGKPDHHAQDCWHKPSSHHHQDAKGRKGRAKGKKGADALTNQKAWRA